ncbi:MAG: FAD-binding oxidoreductase [Fimbriimonadaceae bacterium]|nr:FAD-binding oxidoreductase [Fimbriimonadaceae bacterium]QYK56604.1 MAG: FAD-binding oxidoreductase [Fimbriimonadaceae bacterium]
MAPETVGGLPAKALPELGGWGRYPVSDNVAVRPEKARQLGPVGEKTLARGLGRSYGDAALNSAGTLVLTERLNRFLEFDAETGVLRAEAGASLAEVVEAMVPQGWFLPVTPGTKFCTLGGCLASDVHGKNHHRDGSFSAHVTRASLVLADGERLEIGPDSNPELFWATAGGMGLTGIVADLSLRLLPVKTAYMRVRHTRTRDLDETVAMLADPAHDARYSVAWVDCLARGRSLGRGIYMAGEHALPEELPLRIEHPLRVKPKRQKPFPIDLPAWALNPTSMRMFNRLLDWVQGGKKDFVCPYEPYFYPLDSVHNWNRMYGKRGFVQYQYVVPTHSALEATRKALDLLSTAGKASFLAVLKRMGPEGQGMLSFPKEGLTLALDIPWSDGLEDLLERLDAVVLEAGGRLYLAKDSRMPRAMFEAGYPRREEFCAAKRAVDPGGRFTSDQARRLGLCP